MSSLTVEAEDGETVMFETSVSDIQTGVSVTGNAITGHLKYLDSGEIADYWGAGNFLALKFDDVDENATSVKVGLDPSEGTGLVELLGDPDMNGVFKITDKDEQKFVVEITDGEHIRRQEYDLSGLTVDEE